jgi:ElaA protein
VGIIYSTNVIFLGKTILTMEINWQCKAFNELSLSELYEILALRTEVFVVEQNCPFQEQDGEKDFKSLHLFGKTTDNQIVAYSRLVPAGLAFAEASIGRVINSPKYRGKGIGRDLMKKSIEELYAHFGKIIIRIGAQYYLKAFYESFGFEIDGEIYLDDGIEHIEMVKMA